MTAKKEAAKTEKVTEGRAPEGAPRRRAGRSAAKPPEEKMVTVPRLKRTVIGSNGKKYYPSESPVEIPYNVAFTHGLIGPGAKDADALQKEEKPKE